MRTFASTAELAAAVGTTLGPSEWLLIDQERIDRFADATDDHQWIHTDPERARRSPFGSTIAHGFLTLTLIPWFAQQMLRVGSDPMGINYGMNRVRFPAPVRVGDRLRAQVELTEATPLDGGVQVVETWTIAIEGSGKPACVAECIVRLMDSPAGVTRALP